MKNFLQYLALSSLAILLLFVYACNKKPCGDYICDNKGILLYDSDSCGCICPVNTRGENCKINLIDSIEGNYTEIDTCGMLNRSSMVSRINDTMFGIVNLGSYTCSLGDYDIYFHINEDEIYIDSQYVCKSVGIFDGYLFYGNGKINYISKEFYINYTVNYFSGGGNQIENCSVYYEKL